MTLNRTALVLIATLASLLGGCASSPVDFQKRSKGATATTLAISTGAGAAIGQQIDPGIGAPAGAVVGLAAGFVADKVIGSSSDRVRAEAREQGRRDERLKVMQQYWQEKTLALEKKAQAGGQSGSGTAAVQYEAGIYEGVRMLPHSDSPTTSATNGEPQR